MSDPNYRSTKFLAENVLAVEMRKTPIFMNKPVHSGPSILEFNTLVMYKPWYDYDYVKPKCEEKVKLCYIDKKVLFSR